LLQLFNPLTAICEIRLNNYVDINYKKILCHPAYKMYVNITHIAPSIRRKHFHFFFIRMWWWRKTKKTLLPWCWFISLKHLSSFMTPRVHSPVWPIAAWVANAMHCGVAFNSVFSSYFSHQFLFGSRGCWLITSTDYTCNILLTYAQLNGIYVTSLNTLIFALKTTDDRHTYVLAWSFQKMPQISVLIRT
jgi:hypothetical protein